MQQLADEHPLIVLKAARDLELREKLLPQSRKSVRITLDRWKDRKDTPLALFIRFSCEAILDIRSEF